MKILYGVQGTGNGHISRARMMAEHFANANADVDWLFSGRDPAKLFDMDVFGRYQTRAGLTFVTESGKLNYFKTATSNKPIRFIKDVYSLPVENYDVVITDFEPVTAWACKLKGVDCIGIGHQYAFGQSNTPIAGDNAVSHLVMRLFAPTSQAIGLHWHPFSEAGAHRIAPPIIPPSLTPSRQRGDHVLVYLPFECQSTVTKMLKRIPNQRFIQYSPELDDGEIGNVLLRKPSVKGFKRHLKSAKAVICNCGFELVSECLHLGIAPLTLPVRQQMEQISNGAALRELALGSVMNELDSDQIRSWLEDIPECDPQSYPDVAKALVDWVLDTKRETIELLTAKLWADALPN